MYYQVKSAKKDLPRLHFWEIYGLGTNFPRVSSFFKTIYEVTASTIKIFLLKWDIRKDVNEERTNE